MPIESDDKVHATFISSILHVFNIGMCRSSFLQFNRTCLMVFTKYIYLTHSSCEILKLNWDWWCGCVIGKLPISLVYHHTFSRVFLIFLNIKRTVLSASPALDWPSASVIMHCTVYMFDISVKQDNIVHHPVQLW